MTIGLDGWSKKNLSNSFLGITACFFIPAKDDVGAKVAHVVLNVTELSHPHTGEHLADSLESCFSEWGIRKDKILFLVTDNGANVVKAVRILSERAKLAEEKLQLHAAQAAADTIGEVLNDEDNDEQTEMDVDSEDSDAEIEDEEEIEVDADVDADGTYSTDDDEAMENSQDSETEGLSEACPYFRLKCMAHTLQLVIKTAYVHYDSVIIKARRLVSRIRRSGPSIKKLHASTGKYLITDNCTRWNSTFMVVKRLLEMKVQVNEVLCALGVDTLLVADWVRLEELASLLEPFATQTDVLQTDACSLSSIIPSLLDLHFHLQAFPHCKSLIKAMLADMRCRFDCFLNPDSPDFVAIPAASCLLDPLLATVLLTKKTCRHCMMQQRTT